MERLTRPLQEHHRYCDDSFAAAENAALAYDWAEAAQEFATFRNEMEAHFRAEESILFPSLEQATGSIDGPTGVMRTEHRQMRDLMEAMAKSVAEEDADGYCGQSETFLVMMQQHNLKEEHMLYPMCDNALASDSGLLADRLAKELDTGS